MFERYSDLARKAIAKANWEAVRRGNAAIDTPHLLLGLIGQADGGAVTALRQIGTDLDRLRADVDQQLEPGPNELVAKLPKTPAVKKAVEYAIEEARSMNLNYTGTEHLLVGLILQLDTPAGAALKNAGVSLAAVRAALIAGADARGQHDGARTIP